MNIKWKNSNILIIPLVAFLISVLFYIYAPSTKNATSEKKEVIKYELEYIDDVEKGIYETTLNKYLSPIKTTIVELNKDFPIEQRNKNNVSTENKDFDLDFDTEVWVYASCDNRFTGNDVVLQYNELSIYEDRVKVSTEFRRENTSYSDANKRLIVLTIIPVKQDVTDLWWIGENYEMEYISSYNGSWREKNYDEALYKYLVPIKTTYGELEKDFPKEKRNKNAYSIPNQEIAISSDTEIWVYASYYDDFSGEKVSFRYDKIDVFEEGIEIKTTFEKSEQPGSEMEKKRLIVLSLIPVNQKVTDLLPNFENYEIEFYPNIMDSDERKMIQQNVNKYYVPQKITVGDLKKYFPVEKRYERNLVTPIQDFDLMDNIEVWVYASYYNKFKGESLKLIYDEVKVDADDLSIRTHFESSDTYSSAAESEVIVLSIIPVNQ